MQERGITLSEMLEARDRRSERQRLWLSGAPDAALLVLTVIMPGSVKRDAYSLTAAREALKALTRRLGKDILKVEEFDLPTGFEAFMLVSLPAVRVKRIACEIEDTHPLGRLFDIDVINKDMTPLGRASLDIAPRRCMLCDNDARVCMRSRAHSYDELIKHIHSLIDSYKSDSYKATGNA